MSLKKIFFLCCLFTVSLGLSQNNALFTQATESYNKGEYAKAIEKYEQILKNGEHSAAVYFNLGNCHYKLNAIGPSVYYFEKALLLNPGDSEILNNLSYAQNMRLDAIEEMPKTEIGELYDSLINFLSFDQWAYAAVSLIFLFVLAYLFYFFLRFASQKRIAFIVSVFSFVLGLLCILMSYLQFQEFKNDNPAVVFSQEVNVSSEPNNNSEIVFTIHEGTKVNVLDQLNEWKKIQLADGQTGWLIAQNIRLLRDF